MGLQSRDQFDVKLSMNVETPFYLKAQVRPSEVKTLTSPLSGIIKTTLRKGQVAEVGTTLVEVFNADFERQKSEIELKIKSKKLESTLAESRWLREQGLLKKKATSMEEYEMREAAYKIALHELHEAEYQYKFIRRKLAKNKEVSNKKIVVLDIFRNTGEKIEEGERIASYYEIDSLQVFFQAPKHLYNLIAVGDAVTFRDLSANTSSNGQIIHIAPFIDSSGFEVAAISTNAVNFANGQEIEVVLSK